MRLTVARVKPTRAAIAPCLNALTGKCKHLMPNTHRGWTGHCSNNQKKLLKKYANIDSKLSQCEDWFGGTTTYTVVSELDDPTWPCIECLPKVVSDFVGEQSRVHIMPISAKWKHNSSIHIGFIVFNGGVTTFFAKSVYVWWIFNHLKCYVACIFLSIVSICSVHVRLGITCMWTYKFTFGSEQLVCKELSSNHFEYHCQVYLFLSFSVLEYHYDLSGFTFLLLISCVSLEINITPISY